MNRRTRTATAALLSLALLVTACGDDDDTEAGTGDTETTEDTAADPAGETSEEAGGEGASDEGTALELTLTDDGLEGLPDTFPGGAVQVSLTLEGSREYASLDFTKVDEGTTVEEFAEGFMPVFEGGPFPEFVQTSAGVDASPGETVDSTILLEPGSYVVWHESVPTDDETPPEIVGALAEVTEGEVTELPETDNEIVARDYEFEPDITGPGTVTFRNEGPDQLHHAVIVDFGTTSVEVAEQAIEPLLNSGEDAPPPDIEGLDPEQVNFDFGGSSVFGPGLGGTFEAEFESGNTYALVCFISDRAGGPPHAIGMDMYEVFAVS